MTNHPPQTVGSELPIIDGAAVRKLRTDRGLTVSDLANQAKMNQGILSGIETGTRVAFARTRLVNRLTDALDVDSEQIIIPATPYAR
jgi:transcriptional regulator with XRE-family HTH domain